MREDLIRRIAEVETKKARAEGLLPCGSSHALFKSLGIPLAQRKTSAVRQPQKDRKNWETKLIERLWGPADLVSLNDVMKRAGTDVETRRRILKRCINASKEEIALERIEFLLLCQRSA